MRHRLAAALIAGGLIASCSSTHGRRLAHASSDAAVSSDGGVSGKGGSGASHDAATVGPISTGGGPASDAQVDGSGPDSADAAVGNGGLGGTRDSGTPAV